MKTLQNIITEKLRLGKNTSCDTYTFKTSKFEFTVQLPFDIYLPIIGDKQSIEYVEKIVDSTYGETKYELFDEHKKLVTRLSYMGINNLFYFCINNNNSKINKMVPLIYYLHGKFFNKREQIELNNVDDIIETKKL